MRHEANAAWLQQVRRKSFSLVEVRFLTLFKTFVWQYTKPAKRTRVQRKHTEAFPTSIPRWVHQKQCSPRSITLRTSPPFCCSFAGLDLSIDYLDIASASVSGFADSASNLYSGLKDTYASTGEYKSDDHHLLSFHEFVTGSCSYDSPAQGNSCNRTSSDVNTIDYDFVQGSATVDSIQPHLRAQTFQVRYTATILCTQMHHPDNSSYADSASYSTSTTQTAPAYNPQYYDNDSYDDNASRRVNPICHQVHCSTYSQAYDPPQQQYEAPPPVYEQIGRAHV